jgi:hypothetical protein
MAVSYRGMFSSHTYRGSGSIRVQFKATVDVRHNKHARFRKRPESVVAALEKETLKQALFIKDTVSEYPGGFGINHRLLLQKAEVFRPVRHKRTGRLLGYGLYDEERYLRARYERTGTLFANWLVSIGSGRDYTVRLRNNAVDKYGHSYAAYVHGPEGVQMDYHARTGWKSLEKTTKLYKRGFENILQDIVDDWAMKV